MRRAAATVPRAGSLRDSCRRAQHSHSRADVRFRDPGVLDRHRGVSVEQRVVPLDRVGCYVPAGRYPLPSSLLMTAIPAVAAGVRDVVAVCPRPEPVVMAAALEAGVSRLFRLGGAHAIAALAYGTESVPRVDKIVGPGNRWVASAKALVASDCGIDFYAGPSEILHRLVERTPGMDRGRSDRPGRTRPRCARRAHHSQPATGEPSRRRSRGPDARRWTSATLASSAWRRHRDAVDGRSDGARQRRRAGTHGRRR